MPLTRSLRGDTIAYIVFSERGITLAYAFRACALIASVTWVHVAVVDSFMVLPKVTPSILSRDWKSILNSVAGLFHFPIANAWDFWGLSRAPGAL